MTKPIPWLKVKAEYLQGATPQSLAKKYKLTAKQVSNKAYSENWTIDNKKIQENLRQNIQSKIETLSNNALEVLSVVMNSPESENKDKVSAARAILDISGLKSIKQEIKADVEGTLNTQIVIDKESIQAEIEKTRMLADE